MSCCSYVTVARHFIIECVDIAKILENFFPLLDTMQSFLH